MYPKVLFYFLLPGALLVVAMLVIFLWDRRQKENFSTEQGNGNPEGAFRGFYHALWVLVLWSGLALSLPLWFSYKQKISSLPLHDRWMAIGTIIIFPLILLTLLRYGARRGYLRWIDGLEWPDKENQ